MPASRQFHYDVAGAGHYGIFSGRRWREKVYPRVRDFIASHQEASGAVKGDAPAKSVRVAKRKEELRASLKHDIDKCVGKRVTDGMLTCVKGAETAEQIDKCLR